jgi:hypothetical protein
MNKLKIAAAALAALVCGQAWAVGRLADVTVYDRAEGRRLPVYWHEGRAYVVGKPGNEYQVTVCNRAREDVLAVVSVDGVNVVTGETANAQQSGYVLEPRRALDIQGWRKSLAETAAFYFTALPDSYAARTGRPDNVGVIGVALFQRKPAGPAAKVAPAAPSAQRGDAAEAPAPASESAAAAGTMARREAERLGTGHGRRESSPARHVEFERATPGPVETIAIYYDSYRNLVARGVIRAPARLPQPFPGFVPDPA